MDPVAPHQCFPGGVETDREDAQLVPGEAGNADALTRATHPLRPDAVGPARPQAAARRPFEMSSSRRALHAVGAEVVVAVPPTVVDVVLEGAPIGSDPHRPGVPGDEIVRAER